MTHLSPPKSPLTTSHGRGPWNPSTPWTGPDAASHRADAASADPHGVRGRRPRADRRLRRRSAWLSGLSEVGAQKDGRARIVRHGSTEEGGWRHSGEAGAADVGGHQQIYQVHSPARRGWAHKSAPGVVSVGQLETESIWMIL